MAKPPKEAFDVGLDPAERAAALERAEEDDIDDVEAARADVGAPVPKSKHAQMVKEFVDTEAGSLIPDLVSIFGEDAESMALDIGKASGIKLVDVKKEKPRVKRPFEPDTLYTMDPDPKIINILLKVLADHGFSRQELIELFQHAASCNVELAYLTRQRLWGWIYNRQIDFAGVEENRTAADENEDSLENKQLIKLLEYDLFDQLNDQARRFHAKPATALAWAIRFAKAAAIL